MLESLEDRMTPATGLTPNQSFVAQAYYDLLARQADSAGLAAWSAQLDQGATRMQVVLGIEGSLEYRTKLVTSLYGSLLHRAPDPGGLANWVAQLGTAQQDSFLTVLAGFLSSTEYFQNAGGNNTVFLQTFYADILHRPIDPGGAQSWGALLSAGVSRFQVSVNILSSQEYRMDSVSSMYVHFLHRSPDPGGQMSWVGALNQGMPIQQVQAGIVASQEYFNNSQNATVPTTVFFVAGNPGA
jgi:hypothetical protein